MLFFPIGYNSLVFYQDFLVNAYFWILIGILFRLPHLALSAPFAAETAQSSRPQFVRSVALPPVGLKG
jgi:hypothetical protein